MADYRFAAQAISRSDGRTAIAAAAYRAGVALADERTGLEHDYTRKSGVLHSEIIAPDDAPDWITDRAALWNQVEASEKRKDAQLAREVQLSLPHELSHEQRVALVRDFVQQNFVAQGMVADIAIHAPPRDGDQRNHHAHVMLTTRSVTRDGFADKRRDWNSKEVLGNWRANWADTQNQHLRRAIGEQAPQVTHKSFAERGIQKTPGHHLGPAATALERRNAVSRRGDLNRASRTHNERVGQVRAYQDKLVERLPTQEKRIGEVVFEVTRLKENLIAERAEKAAELATVLKDMRGKRTASMSLVERVALEPFEEKEREAKRELAAAQQRAQVPASPKQIMRWFTNPAASLWSAAKTSMATDAAGNRLAAVQVKKADFKQWLKTDEGKAFTRNQIAVLTKNSSEIEVAARKVQAAERATVSAKTYLKSEKGIRDKIAKVQELQGDLSSLRVKERKARRNIAQLDRLIRAADRTGKVAQGLAQSQLVETVKMPIQNINTTAFLRNVQGGLNDMVKGMTLAQRQTLSRALSIGFGIGRGV
jgi:hypothetical protein